MRLNKALQSFGVFLTKKLVDFRFQDGIYLKGVKVVGTQQPSIAAVSTGEAASAEENAEAINEIIAVMEAHGLIANGQTEKLANVPHGVGKPMNPVLTGEGEESEPSTVDNNEEPKATKGAVALAHAEGVDLTDIEGTGQDGQITVQDVRDYLSTQEPEGEE